MEERLRHLERRLAQAEQNIARLNKDVPAADSAGTTLTAPLSIVNAEGKAILFLSADDDGGYIHLCDLEGKLRVTLGCDAHGGWFDIIHAGSERLAVTLTATPDGGNIEVTDKDGKTIFDAAQGRA